MLNRLCRISGTKPKIKDRRGFTVAELMMVVALLLIIMSVAIVAIINYQRSLRKLEFDGYAKEIFVAAQNNLVSAESQGYLGRAKAGLDDGEDGVYYFVANSSYANSTSVDDKTSILELMLPAGAVDDVVRSGGCYVIRYHKDLAMVLDVFYWSEDGKRFSHDFVESDYISFLALKTDNDALKKYGSDKAVIGYYGGTNAEGLAVGETLVAPSVSVVNADKLYVTVKDNNSVSATSDSGYNIKLVVKGKSSSASKEIALGSLVADSNVSGSYDEGYTIILDDITTNGMHFYDLFSGAGFIPGEDIAISAKAYNSSLATNVAGSMEQSVNSLFDNSTNVASKNAGIGSIRHLENLSYTISGVNDPLSSVNFTSASQTTDLNWSSFKSSIGDDALCIYLISDSAGSSGCYMPVDPSGSIDYDAAGHMISNIVVDSDSNGGVFGSLSFGSVTDLKLSDIKVSAVNAGALAGSVSGTTLNNVLAVSRSSSNDISGSSNSGGLVGKMAGAAVNNCAAAVIVRSSEGAAGGLIGSAESGSIVSASYSGGHTQNAAYSSSSYNVTGSTAAGGLIGTAADTTFSCCYSTCSAYASLAGGFAGSSEGSISNCYAAAPVKGSQKGAFAGSFSGTASNCYYYSIVNESISSAGKYVYLGAVNGASASGITALDASASSYGEFTGDPNGWAGAVAYDTSLNKYYRGKYSLRTVAQLGASAVGGSFVSVHYGDWPAPELWIVNDR